MNQTKREITIKSFAKINLSLDVLGVLENGLHQVDMIMQQISLQDLVTISLSKGKDTSSPGIILTCNNPHVPTGPENLAYGAVLVMMKFLRDHRPDEYQRTYSRLSTKIDIEKNIPVAAGLAGGSGNCAAVLHGLNALLELNLSLEELCGIGRSLGSDVPFCLIGQAKGNPNLPKNIREDRLASFAARAQGTGTDLRPVRPIGAKVVIEKPDFGVSTGEVYRGIDHVEIPERPDTDKLEKDMNIGNPEEASRNMINVLENYTLSAYPQVKELKNKLKAAYPDSIKVLMSGSGPTVFVLLSEYVEGELECLH